MKKLNIGVVCTIIVLILVIMYNINIESQRKEDKLQIENICKNYLTFSNNYTMLDKNCINMSLNISQQEYNLYLSNMKTEIKKYFINDNNYINNQYEIMKKILDKQLQNKSFVITDMNQNITKMDKYIFSGNTAQVSFNVNVNVKYLINSNDVITNKVESNNVTDTIVFQKINGIWKVTYAKLNNISLLKDVYISDIYILMNN